MNKDILQFPESIVEQEVTAICKRYRIDPDVARRTFIGYFGERPDLARRILTNRSEKDIIRLKQFKNAVKQLRKEIYYHLRRYQQQNEDTDQLIAKIEAARLDPCSHVDLNELVESLLMTHISTAERHPYCKQFYQQLADIISSPRGILDIGCGLHPLSYFFYGPNIELKQYVAVDRNLKITNLLEKFVEYMPLQGLLIRHSCLSRIDSPALSGFWDEEPELTLMLKLVPVIYRQQPELIPLLANAMGKNILITAAKEAMTRHETIQRREDRILYKFIKATGRKIIAAIDIGNEFGYFLGEK